MLSLRTRSISWLFYAILVHAEAVVVEAPAIGGMWLYIKSFMVSIFDLVVCFNL
jgi:hypothetical protein